MCSATNPFCVYNSLKSQNFNFETVEDELDPSLNDIFIAEVEGVLQVVKRNHQSHTDCGPPGIGAIGRAEKLIESIPVHDIGQLDQPMAGIGDAAKLNPEQILLPIVVGRFFWFHTLKNCKVLEG
jgi:hypothetical protein